MRPLLLCLFLAWLFAALLSCVTSGTTDWQKSKTRQPLKPGAWYAETK